MFNFGREEATFRSMKAEKHKYANFRMEGFRHNPYVGSFHAVPYSNSQGSLLMEESKRNPMVGLFRHSPPAAADRLGLKSVIYDDTQGSVPVVSQLRVHRDSKLVVPTKSIVNSLRQMPMTIFTSSSILSGENSVPVPEPTSAVEGPMCSICLEKYNDGDEIVTLACSHCFHSECANKWFYESCIRDCSCNEGLRCPQCRQDHIALSEQGSCNGGEEVEKIPSKSFLQVGESLLRDGGYDFLSDVGSDLPGSTGRQVSATPQTGIAEESVRESVLAFSPRRRLEWSAYSDCGFPLLQSTAVLATTLTSASRSENM